MSMQERINRLKETVEKAEKDAHRSKGSVNILPVSKGQSIAKIKTAYELGFNAFGENYLQEAQEKIAALSTLAIHWHFIGPVQSNKTKAIAALFDWVHTVDRFKIAQLLDQYRSSEQPPLMICLQVNLSGEASKSGVTREQAFELIEAMQALKHVQCRGLMTIPPASASEDEQFAIFSQLKTLLEQLNDQYHLNMDTLSMGMTNDLIQAIAAGSTIVRVGRALFGERL